MRIIQNGVLTFFRFIVTQEKCKQNCNSFLEENKCIQLLHLRAIFCPVLRRLIASMTLPSRCVGLVRSSWARFRDAWTGSLVTDSLSEELTGSIMWLKRKRPAQHNVAETKRTSSTTICVSLPDSGWVGAPSTYDSLIP